MIRYRFSDFTLSPQRRLLVRHGQEVPLIPRYFDLLLLLIERRREAVHRREIFERVWGDVSVSESALSQAVRTIRRTLDDDPREPRFIRTVSRHGYQFVFPDVIEEEEEDVVRGGAPLETSVVPPRMLAPVPTRDEDEWPWFGGAVGGALAGIVAGSLGGLILAAAPESRAPVAIAPVLAAIAGVAGGLGGAGVGAGIAVAKRVSPEHRIPAFTAGASIGGGLVGAAVQWLTRWALASLVGMDLQVGGGVEGMVIGACAGLGFALGTRNRGHLPAAALVTALSCGAAGLVLAWSGRPLAGGTIHAIAQAAEGSRATLAPLGRLIGEPDFGPLSRTIAAFGECAMFGLGLGSGLIWRERRRAHRNLT